MRLSGLFRRPVGQVAASSLMVGVLVSVWPPAHASAVQRDPAELAAAVAGKLGSRTAGPYIDGSGRPVVTVTNDRDAAIVRSSGVIAKRVPRSGADLARISAELDRSLHMPGTGWSVDPVTAQLAVQADVTVTGARLARVRRVVGSYGSAVRFRTVPGRMGPMIAGGRGIYTSGGGYCSLGFNVRKGSVFYFLTAGHCTEVATTWYLSNGVVVGLRAGSSYPGNDYGIVRHTNSRVRKDGMVYLYNGYYRNITGTGTPVVGTTVERSGVTSGRHSGRITGLNTVVYYGSDRLSGMIQTNVCVEPGDSGGPLFRGTAALGLTSGGWGDCTYGGETWFQPVIEAVRRYGVTVY